MEIQGKKDEKRREYFKNKSSGRITMSKTKEDTGSAVPELREGAQRDYIKGGGTGGRDEEGYAQCSRQT